MRKSSLPSGFIGCQTPYEEAEIVIFGAPFDSTASFRPGARFGPAAIRNESFGIETYSPYQDADLLDGRICDIGDLDLPIGDIAQTLQMIEDETALILQDDKIPCLLGGEHLVTLGALRAVAKKYPDVCVIHLDAHADLRQDYLGLKLSHACVMRRVWEILGDHRIYQFGIRSGDKEEFDFAKSGHVDMVKFNLEGLATTLQRLGNTPIYFTLDLDVLCPGLFSGTGTPEAGGICFDALHGALLLLKNCNVVGMDVNELAPQLDMSGVSTAVACKVLRELLLSVVG